MDNLLKAPQLVRAPWSRLCPFPDRDAPISGRADPAEEEVVKTDALIRLILLGNRSLEEFAVLLARISLGVFFAIFRSKQAFRCQST